MVGSCENEGAFTRNEILRAREGGASLGTLIERDSAHALRLHVLASGSKGNAALIENIESGQVVAIDCGICKRDFFARSEEAGIDLSCLTDLFITHDHTDHTKGLGVVLRALAKRGVKPLVHVSEAVHEASRDVRDNVDDAFLRKLEPDRVIRTGGMDVVAFHTSHDAAESFGFRIEANGDSLGFMTDSGIVTEEAHEALSGCRVLALESNFDEAMLENGTYPYAVRRRIASDYGHLSNSQARAELSSLLHAGLEAVVAMHISENNNQYRLAVEGFRSVIGQQGQAACVICGYQNRLSRVL